MEKNSRQQGNIPIGFLSIDFDLCLSKNSAFASCDQARQPKIMEATRSRSALITDAEMFREIARRIPANSNPAIMDLHDEGLTVQTSTNSEARRF